MTRPPKITAHRRGKTHDGENHAGKLVGTMRSTRKARHRAQRRTAAPQIAEQLQSYWLDWPGGRVNPAWKGWNFPPTNYLHTHAFNEAGDCENAFCYSNRESGKHKACSDGVFKC